MKYKFIKSNGLKAHYENTPYKVGKIRLNSWATKVLRAYSVVIFERDLIHLNNSHNKELNIIGFSPFDYVKFIFKNFNSIYEGRDNAKILAYVPKNQDISHRAVIELVFYKKQYKIKTATPIKTERLLRMKLLCANSRFVGY